ncbi:serine protease Do [Chitinophaga niastensis]|uniref:Serine protease Do n=1 Tax=Chitinophaga niastensis TaxID=536980 RepID=A0A2P8HTR8_CHINA|nr:PDZ domain-containing protein [Chitinophaga niastensis]PSL49630.1 serine protease Do [Chitinophaga niastensis]
MTRLLQILTLAGFSCFTMGAVSAQTKNTPKSKMGEFDEIVIKRKSDKDSKITVEIKDGDILINGKKVDQFRDPNISVLRRRITPLDGNSFSMEDNMLPGGIELFNEEGEGGDIPITANKALLGVMTEKAAATGITVKSTAKGSPADKAGIKAGDIITKVDDEKMNEPAELFETIGKHQPGDKITVTYIRDKKEKKVVVTLDERKEENARSWKMYPPLSSFGNGNNSFSFPPAPRGHQGLGYLEEEAVKLGLQVQDTENDEGAQVIDIAPASPAEEAGFKKDDIVTDLAGNTIKTTKDLSRAYRENRIKGTITATVKRNGQTQTLEIKIPKKLNKADL